MTPIDPAPPRAPERGGIVGLTYYERGRPVVVTIQWGPSGQRGIARGGRRAPRNVAIRREDGTVTVRPFRGLRRNPPEAAA